MLRSVRARPVGGWPNHRHASQSMHAWVHWASATRTRADELAVHVRATTYHCRPVCEGSVQLCKHVRAWACFSNHRVHCSCAVLCNATRRAVTTPPHQVDPPAGIARSSCTKLTPCYYSVLGHVPVFLVGEGRGGAIALGRLAIAATAFRRASKQVASSLFVVGRSNG